MEGTSADASFDGEILYETRHTASFFLSYKIEYHPPDGWTPTRLVQSAMQNLHSILKIIKVAVNVINLLNST
jgi:hypothetical protein